MQADFCNHNQKSYATTSSNVVKIAISDSRIARFNDSARRIVRFYDLRSLRLSIKHSNRNFNWKMERPDLKAKPKTPMHHIAHLHRLT